nr:hypothetical protein CFP56_30072 [Quercus suber]
MRDVNSFHSLHLRISGRSFRSKGGGLMWGRVKELSVNKVPLWSCFCLPSVDMPGFIILNMLRKLRAERPLKAGTAPLHHQRASTVAMIRHQMVRLPR